MQLAIYIC